MDAEGVVWVCTDRGLDALVPGSKQFKHYKHNPKDPNSLSSDVTISLYEDQAGVLWIGTGGGGLNAMDKRRTTITRYKSQLHDRRTLSHDFVTSICEQDSRHLWVGTQVGLNRLDRVTGTFTRLMHEPADPTSLIDNYVTKIFRDGCGTLWVVTDRGLSKRIKRNAEFSHYQHEPERFSSQAVTAILEDGRGFLWIGTENGAKRYDRIHNTVVHYTPGASRRNLLGNYVQAIIEDHLGFIWIGTLDGGVNKQNLDGTFEHFTWHSTRGSAVLMCLREDSDGNLWIGTMGDGLLRFHPKRKKFEHFTYPGSIRNNTVPALLIDKSNVLWVGTEGGGLSRLDVEQSRGSQESFFHFRHDASRAGSIGNDRIHALCEDRNGRLWVATGDGLDLYDRERQTFDHVLVNGSSFSGLILAIVEDGNGSLWLSTMQNGVYMFDPEMKRVEKFDAGDGLQSNRFTYANAKSTTGEIFFGGENGLTLFHPDSIQKHSDGPRVVLTELRLFEEPIGLDSIFAHTKDIELSYQQNYFSFEFAALDFCMPWKNEYLYKLQGLDRDWIPAGRRRTAAYTNIDPGKYIFRVKGSNSDLMWGTEELVIPLTIMPPYWATWWFRGLVLIVAIGVIMSAYRYRVGKLLEIERMRLRIASDLHDDIGSSLGSIALTSDDIQSDVELPITKKKQLAEISRAARKTAESLRDIVWVLSPTCDTAEGLVLKLRDEASVMLQFIEYSFEFVEEQKDVVLDMDLRHNVILIFKEALHNVVKHSRATLVAIEVIVSRNELELRIRDNGIGFQASAKQKGNGIENMKRRGEKLGCFQVESNDQEGTSILLIARIP
jgi:ligand-binding sensor domain-containing protein/two-component sensor histidine kinase